MRKYIKELENELGRNIDLKYKDGAIRFFKEEVNPLGVRTGKVRKIALIFYSENKNKFSKEDWITLCEALWQEKIGGKSVSCFEYGIIINQILKKLVKNLEKKDFYIFEKWIDKYVTNWAHCDILCAGIIGEIIRKYPILTNETLTWVKSKNRWKKRASAVCYIKLSIEKKFLPTIFKTSKLLINESDDLVQKGYGWALKDASKNYKKEVIEFLLKNKNMPRTALRYACERLSKEEKEKILY